MLRNFIIEISKFKKKKEKRSVNQIAFVAEFVACMSCCSSGVTETLGGPRNLIRWDPYVGTSVCRDLLLVGGP